MNDMTPAQVPAKVAKAQIASGGSIRAIVPQDIDQTFRLAGAIAMSQMAPKSYNNDEKRIFVGILAGMEIGLTPMAALQSIAVIGNMPAIWGDGALGLVQASGLLEDFEETDDGNTATCRAVRKGIPSPFIKTFSMEDAKRAGLAGKSGPWTQYPARMRQMRARLLVLRDGFSDILKGIRIAEEVRDYPQDAFADDAQNAPRLTSKMLANHASDDINQRPEAEIAEAEIAEITQSEQSPASDSTSQHFDDGQPVASDPEPEAEAGAASDADEGAPWDAMVADWKARIESPELLGDVIGVRNELKAHRDALPTDVTAELDGLLDQAAAKFTNKEK